MTLIDIPVKCTRCRHQCMESHWLNNPVKTTGSISMTEKVCPKCGCRSYYDMRPQVAWCWASGLIEIGDKEPSDSADGGGAIKIASGAKSELHGVLSALARKGQGASAGKLLVPGVPEGASQKDAFSALQAWLAWAAKGNGNVYRHSVVFEGAI
ncbi:MAG: hypothetical protein PHQ13_03440 [Rhodoferax sp.]|nr:hypothetical protein [Rhodoferax sp.]